MERVPPIVVDLDGTLARTDTLVEAILVLLLHHPSQIPGMIRAFFQGRATLKKYLADVGCYDAAYVPLREELLQYLKGERSKGREICLATAADQSVADAVAERVGIFSRAIGSEPSSNLKGPRKLAAIRENVAQDFVYAGNDANDIPIWKESKGIIVAGSDARALRTAKRISSERNIPILATFPDKASSFKVWLRALRIHQWVKNLLLFVPIVLAHRFNEPLLLVKVAIGFLCVGFVASGTYLLNDLADLRSDRRHLEKRNRPLASAAIGIPQAIAIGIALLVAGLGTAVALDLEFALALVVYTVVTVAYSMRLKKIAILDVFVIAVLFTLRIVMGAAIIDVIPSGWLVTFSVFFFFSLSVAKRYVEIRKLAEHRQGKVHGRGYLVSDAPLLLSLGVSSSSAATVTLFLYIVEATKSMALYTHPEWLHGCAFMVFLWTCRIWLKAHRGKLHHDPIVFAIKDGPSWAIGLGVALFFVASL